MSENEIAVVSNGPNNLTSQLLAKFGAVRVVKQVTRTVLQQHEGIPFGVTFETSAIESQVAQVGRGGKEKMEPARICNVINLETGAHQILIMNTVLEGELSRNYPDQSYVGKSFLCNGYRPLDENDKPRRYKVYEIIEIAIASDGAIEGKELVADASDPVNVKGNKPKG